MDVLTISLGRNILVQGSREFLRMQSYAAQLSTFHIVVLTRKSHGFIHAVHDLKLHVYPTNSSSRVMMLVDAFLIGRQIARARREGTLVITAQDPLEIGWVCWLLSFIKNTRLHIQVHGDYFSSGAWVGGSLLRYIRRIFAYVLLTRAPTIRVVSKRIADSLIQKGIKRDRLTILPIRPEIETFFNVERIPRTVPPYTFLYVGRLAPEKDIPRILYAFAELQKKHNGINLRIVGDGGEEKKILSLIHTLTLHDCVTLAPWTENVPSEMARADVFLLASKHEAYALTLVEALATGTPVVTTNVGCVGELVIDGVHGVVVTETGVLAYMTGMKKMITDEAFRKSCGKNGKEAVRKLMHVSPHAYARAWVTSLSQT